MKRFTTPAIEIEDADGLDLRQHCCPGCQMVVVIVIPAVGNPGDIAIRHPIPACTWMTLENAVPWLRRVCDPMRVSLPS